MLCQEECEQKFSKIILLGQLLAWLFCFFEDIYRSIYPLEQCLGDFFFFLMNEKMQVDVK